MEETHLSPEQLTERIVAQVKDLSDPELIDRGTMPLMCLEQYHKVKRWIVLTNLRFGQMSSRNRWDNRTIGADAMMGERSLHNPGATLAAEQEYLVELAVAANVRYYTIFMVVWAEQSPDQPVTGERVRQTIELDPGLRQLLQVPSRPKDRTMDIHGLLTVVTNRQWILGTENLQLEKRVYATHMDQGTIRQKLNLFFSELIALAGVADARHRLNAELIEAHNNVFSRLGWEDAAHANPTPN